MSPFRSEAQRRKFRLLVKEGKMSEATLKEWESHTAGNLPERVKPKTGKTGARKKRRKWTYG